MRTAAPELFNAEVTISRLTKTVLVDLRNTMHYPPSDWDSFGKLRILRPIIIETDSFVESAGSLNRAIMISVLRHIRNASVECSFIDELVSVVSSFKELCHVILKANGGAAVIILGDFAGLVCSPKVSLFQGVNNGGFLLTNPTNRRLLQPSRT